MDEKPVPKPVRIAIIGAGIGGLTLSSALKALGEKCNLEIDIYEGAAVISEIGAGINCWPRTWRIMRQIGLEEHLVKFLEAPPNEDDHVVFEVRKSDQSIGYGIRDIVMKGGAIKIHRADLQQVLISQMTGRLHLSHRLVSYEEAADEVHLHFSNGVSTTCDLLIGMDGINSVVRKLFLKKLGMPGSLSFDPVWSGEWAYRGIISAEELSAKLPGHRALVQPMMYVGKYKHLVAYPMSRGKLVNVVAMVTSSLVDDVFDNGPTNAPCAQSEVLDAYRGWEPEVQALLQCVNRPTKWALRSINPIGRYALGRVILAGDAAHAMLPHQDAGAGQAIEDAYILSNLLCHAKGITSDIVPKIADIYNSIRCPEGNKVLEASIMSGHICQLMAPGFEDVVEGDRAVAPERLHDLYETFTRQWDWVWKESAEEDKQRALDMLEYEMH